MQDELIRVLGHDSERVEDNVGKVFEVRSRVRSSCTRMRSDRLMRRLLIQIQIIGRKFSQRGFPIGVGLSFLFSRAPRSDSPMGAHFAVIDLSFIEQLD